MFDWAFDCKLTHIPNSSGLQLTVETTSLAQNEDWGVLRISQTMKSNLEPENLVSKGHKSRDQVGVYVRSGIHMLEECSILHVPALVNRQML